MTIDETVQEQLIALLPRLRRFAFSLTGSRYDADDLVQSACERALKNLHQWQPNTRLDSWMFRITKNIWIDTWRSRKAQGRCGDLEEADYAVDNYGDTKDEARDTLRRVALAMQNLPDEQRLALTLVSVEGLSYKEAAEVLDIPVGTVMSRLARARRKLHEFIT